MPIANDPQSDGRRALRVNVTSPTVPGDYDNGSVTYPTPTQEIYKFYKGATLLKTITMNYSDASKSDLVSWTIA